MPSVSPVYQLSAAPTMLSDKQEISANTNAFTGSPALWVSADLDWVHTWSVRTV